MVAKSYHNRYNQRCDRGRGEEGGIFGAVTRIRPEEPYQGNRRREEKRKRKDNQTRTQAASCKGT